MRQRQIRPLQSVPDVESWLQYRTVHGYRRAFRTAGSGPQTVLLIHGIGDNSRSWDQIIAPLAQHYTVIAPDLLGHGRSDKPRADYSISRFANGLRDLLTVLGVEKVTIIGHSLGGGVAMQFAYQYPESVQRIILVATGGVTTEVNPVMRMVSLPMLNQILRVLRAPGAPAVLHAMGSVLTVLARYPPLHDTEDLMRVISALRDPTAAEAFLRTLRSGVDWRGQVVTMLDRCYMTKGVPVQIIWGDADLMIPVDHAYLAHAAMPGSRLEIFEEAGHFPHHDDRRRFLAVVEDFIAGTQPASYDHSSWRQLLLNGVDDTSISGPSSAESAVLHAIVDDERSAT